MIILYKGSMGRGKTLTMVRDAFLYYLAGYRIITNMSNLKFGEYMNNKQIIQLNKESNLYNCVLVIDELQMLIDSRNFGKDQNKDFSYFIMQVRKRKIIVLGTAQFTDSIEKRFRQNLDVVCSPKYYEEMGICTAQYYDVTILEDLDFNPSMLNPVTIVYEVAPIFNLYDTNEMLV